ncbi:MAG: DUF47 domain-containing protein [Saccharofermentanales bacterium]|jgi:uncharacterized protein Yka (UPF0111/DUF47 family)
MFGKPKKNDYFAMLRELVTYSERAADFLETSIQNFDPDNLEEALVAMHEIEHAADLALHEVTQKLAREFITPIERQDIFDIGNKIDDVTDAIEEVLIRFYMFNVRELRDETFEFGSIITQATQEMTHLMDEFGDFRQSSNDIRRHMIEINHLEERGDVVYMRSLRRLYTSDVPAVEVVAWTEIFRRLERCCDDVEDLSQMVEHVIMKNT